MSDTLTFMMGEFAAEFPTDRRYAKNHMWGAENGELGNWGTGLTDDAVVDVHITPSPHHPITPSPTFRFGFAAYAVRLLQDVYFLDWDVEEGVTLNQGQEIGQIESSKAESALFAPISGTLSAINQTLLKDPSAINVDKYGTGWLFEISGPDEDLLDPAAYLEHLEAVWEVTQKTIKGQLNQ